MDNLLDFYKRVLESIGLSYNENGNVVRLSKTTGKETIVMIDGKPLVLPTKNHIDTLVELDEKNQPCIRKILFNPLNEDMIKGDSHSLVKLKEFISCVLNYSLFTSCMLLLHLGKEKHLQDEATMLTTEYLSSLSNIDRGANVKRLIDDETINHWEKIHEKMLTDGFKTNNIVNIFIKKRGRDSKGEMSNRLTTISSSLLDELEKLKEEKSPVYLGVKLRTKDVKVFVTTLNFLLDNLDIRSNSLSIGSCNNLAPAFVSLFSMYLKFIEKPNQILKDLRYVNYDYSDSGYMEVKITMDEILNVDQYKTVLHSIPNDIEAHRMANNNVANVPVEQSVVVNQAPVPSTGNSVQDYINRKRQSQGIPFGYPPQQMIVPQVQQPYQQQMFIQPQQVAYQQPMYVNQNMQQVPQGYIQQPTAVVVPTGHYYK